MQYYNDTIQQHLVKSYEIESPLFSSAKWWLMQWRKIEKNVKKIFSFLQYIDTLSHKFKLFFISLNSRSLSHHTAS